MLPKPKIGKEGFSNQLVLHEDFFNDKDSFPRLSLRFPPLRPMLDRNAAQGGSVADDFGRLIQIETELDRQLAAARAEADRLVAAARDDAAAREAALERELAELARSFQSDVDAERARRAEEILKAAERQSGQFRRIAPEEIERLAGRMLGRLLGELR
jgi:vacuolar-type H+-ATPase subunit H